MRSATSSGKCSTLCNSSSSPGKVCIDDVDAAVAPANGGILNRATVKMECTQNILRKKEQI